MLHWFGQLTPKVSALGWLEVGTATREFSQPLSGVSFTETEARMRASLFR